MKKVDMCFYYGWAGRTICSKHHWPSLKCHSERKDCPDYECSWHYDKEVTK